jgi:hypothetical protein
MDFSHTYEAGRTTETVKNHSAYIQWEDRWALDKHYHSASPSALENT